MNTKTRRLVWLAVPCLVASIAGSLLAVWALSGLADFHFNPSIVAMLSAAVCATAIAATRLRRQGRA